MSNIVYIGASMDGYIAAPDGNLDWLDTVPAPEGDDLGWSEFIARVDAVVMGRITFETVVGFDVGWPYPVPGIVLSTTVDAIPDGFSEHITLTRGTPAEVIEFARQQGHEHLYIDGGNTIQRFLREDLIDELIITQIPILLGGGDPLFGSLEQQMVFELIKSEVLAGQLVKSHYRRKQS